jgi:glycosyltransferase involved in cell wall biosynthesis
MPQCVELFYPASYLPHKNHSFLSDSHITEAIESCCVNISLTISCGCARLSSPNIRFLGRLGYAEVVSWYDRSDALLILSSAESLCLPLIEAANYNLPVIAPLLPYVHELLGDSFYGFNSMSPVSVAQAIASFVDDYRLGRCIRPVLRVEMQDSFSFLSSLGSAFLG